MEKELQEKFEMQEAKLEKILCSVEKTRKYFLWTLIVSIITAVLPFLALIFVIPWFIKILTSAYGL